MNRDVLGVGGCEVLERGCIRLKCNRRDQHGGLVSKRTAHFWYAREMLP